MTRRSATARALALALLLLALLLPAAAASGRELQQKSSKNPYTSSCRTRSTGGDVCRSRRVRAPA
jgi:ABC-type sugar transport system substrate-binding protein